ncbi:MAG: DUF2147 domain-containing protein [Bacteroidales bacterium]|jgi:uncharacterized protein (DUF2147 family)|nr:DUF2147 domain-containing protein [Bacteroidales bacterium]
MMRKFIILLTFSLFCTGFTQAQYKADDLLGYYYVEDPFIHEGSQIFITKNGSGLYEAVVTWVENPKKKKFIGLLFLEKLKWDEKDKEWNDGTIKYPGKNGNFSVNMHFVDANTLKVRGYWGIAMLGKTVYWKKEKSRRKQD